MVTKEERNRAAQRNGVVRWDEDVKRLGWRITTRPLLPADEDVEALDLDPGVLFDCRDQTHIL